MSTRTQTFKVGDRVTFPPDALVKPSLIGIVFTIETVPTGRKVKYGIRAEHGGPIYGVRAEQVIPAPEGDMPAGARPFQPIEFFTEGEPVTISNGQRKKIADDEPFIVIKDSGRDTVGVARLGGEGGRYWNWPRNGLVKRDLAWLTEKLVERA